MTRYTPNWIQQGNYAAVNDRRVLGAIWPNEAVSGMACTADGMSMVVNIAQGAAAVSLGAFNSVLCSSNALEQVMIAAANATNPRIDLIVAQVRSNELDGGTNNDWLFQVVAGTPAATPVVPAEPARSVAIAQVYVAAGAVTINQAAITDARKYRLDQPWDTAWGEVVLPAKKSDSQAGITTPFVDLTGLSVSWPAFLGRRYEVQLHLPSVQQVTAAGTVTLRLIDAANNVRAGAVMLGLAAGAGFPASMIASFDPVNSSTLTWRAQAQTSAGTLTVNCATYPGVLIVRDVGPAPGVGGTLLEALFERAQFDPT
jgi:hypothetical protein